MRTHDASMRQCRAMEEPLTAERGWSPGRSTLQPPSPLPKSLSRTRG